MLALLLLTVITCKVVEPSAITCQTPNRSVTIELWDWHDEAYSEWLWQTDNADSTPHKAVPKVGQMLKARWLPRAEFDALIATARAGRASTNEPIHAVVLADGALLPIADCKVRAARQVAKYAADHPGELVPNTVRTEPDDCQPKPRP